MRAKAARFVDRYITDVSPLRTRPHPPGEQALAGELVTGRAEVVSDDNDGVAENLAIVDYKTSTRGEIAGQCHV